MPATPVSPATPDPTPPPADPGGGVSPRLREIVEIALEHTVNGVVITDARRPHNPIVHVNGGFSRITGYQPDEVLGRNCNFLQGHDRDQPGVATLRDAIARRVPVTVVLRNYRKDGALFFNRVELCPVADPERGEVTHFFALQTDVTLEVQAEEARAQRLLALERAFDSSPVAMLGFDDAGRVTLATPAFARVLGLARPAVGTSMDDLRLCIAECAGLDADATAALRWPEPGETVHWSWPNPDEAGHPRQIELTAAASDSLDRTNVAQRAVDLHHASRAAASSPGGERVVMLRDVSHEQSAEASRSRFLATAAHELRTPLGSIRGFTELLLMRNFPPDKARGMLETVLNQASRLGALLDDLLDLSQLDAMGREAFAIGSVDLPEVVRRAAQVLGVGLQGRARHIALHVPDACPPVRGHAAKLEQVLINLLSNAIKYSPEGGDVTLTVSIESPSAGRRVCVQVQDRGIGLSEEQQARLFTRFYRANPSGPIPGTGLGLSIVKGLVERMGGRISVRSQVGQGSTFTVELLPADAAEGAVEPTAAEPVVAPP